MASSSSGSTSNPPRPPRWMDDGDSPTCLACAAEFGVLLRRHHCRRCGGLFCHDCSNHWVRVPAALLVAPPPFALFADVDPAVPNRCCAACVAFVNDFHEQRRQRAEQQRAALRAEALAVEQRIPSRLEPPPHPHPHPSPSGGPDPASSDPPPDPTAPATVVVPTASAPDDVWAETNAALAATGLLIVPCVEYHPSTDPASARYKLHLVNVPMEIPAARKFQVQLDRRLLTVVLPREVRPGDRVLIQAPAPPVALKRAAAAQVPPPTKREGYVTCPRCSFDNSVALVACQMCREPLGAGALAAQRLPEARVLELDEAAGDVPRRYVTRVPFGVRPDDVFEVVLELRPFTVICPGDAQAGDNIAVWAPALASHVAMTSGDGGTGDGAGNAPGLPPRPAEEPTGGIDTLPAPAAATPPAVPESPSVPVPSPTAPSSSAPSSSSRVCRLCTFDNTPANIRALGNPTTTTATADMDRGDAVDAATADGEEVRYCGMCGEALAPDALPPVATPVPSAVPALTVVSSLRSVSRPAVPPGAVRVPAAGAGARDGRGGGAAAVAAVVTDAQPIDGSSDVTDVADVAEAAAAAAEASAARAPADTTPCIPSSPPSPPPTEAIGSALVGHAGPEIDREDVSFAATATGPPLPVVAEGFVQCPHCHVDNPPGVARCEVCRLLLCPEDADGEAAVGERLRRPHP